MVTIKQGDCLEKMKDIPDKSIDMILCDLPYGTTACKWDVVIPFEPLWEQYERVIKDNGAIVLFGSEPFSSYLRMSNIKNYKYDWVWDKKLGTGFLNSKKQPLRRIENIIVFYKKQCCYYPIMRKGVKRFKGHKGNHSLDKIYSDYKATNVINDEYYPTSILEFSNAVKTGKLHPTQKPVSLLEYLIKTYTLEGETVLDNCMGSGSTGVACINTKRNFIGIEKDDKYFEVAKKRIADAMNDSEGNDRDKKAKS